MPSIGRSINGKTLSTINVISSWVVNTFYNYLHQQAIHIHTSGRASSITDAYKFIVRQYLDSFNDSEGYRRNLTALHKYYMDNTRYSSIPFDEWVKDILQQFVPTDYFSIMSNSQQDATLRGIIVNAVTQFSSDVVCTQILDTLITNHDNPNLIQIMKKNMSNSLIFEREKLFQALFNSSSGISANKPMENMKNEIAKLIEENVLLKHKNLKTIKLLKGALSKMKEQDCTITSLRQQNSELIKKSGNKTIYPSQFNNITPIIQQTPSPIPITRVEIDEISKSPIIQTYDQQNSVELKNDDDDDDDEYLSNDKPITTFVNTIGDTQTVSLDINDFLNM
jgi:regulator of replication initiation timing